MDEITLKGAIEGRSYPYTIDNTESIVREISFPDKSKPIKIGKYCTTPAREGSFYEGGYLYPAENLKSTPSEIKFIAFIMLTSTFPWESGARDIFDTLKIRNQAMSSL